MPKIDSDNPYRLAVNIFDLDRVVQSRRENLGLVLQESGGLLIRSPIRVDKNKPDEVALEFNCPLLRAAIICDILRRDDRESGDAITRVYIRKKVWSKVSENAQLTVVERGTEENGHEDRTIPNPKLFESINLPSLPPRPVAARRID